MNANRWTVVVACCFLGASVWLHGSPTPTAAQIPGGRFEMFVTNHTNDVVYLCDVQTGQCWRQTPSDDDKRWKPLGSPVIKVAE